LTCRETVEKAEETGTRAPDNTCAAVGAATVGVNAPQAIDPGFVTWTVTNTELMLERTLTAGNPGTNAGSVTSMTAVN